MRLTIYSDYALRSLIFLAVHNKAQLVNISDIATAYDISKNHLTKVIHHLAKAGYIDSTRGKHGGICLAKLPEQINIGTLIRLTEQDFAIVACLNSPTNSDMPLIDTKNHCVITPVCQLKGIFAKATNAFLAVLDNYTLADIVSNQDDLLYYLDL